MKISVVIATFNRKKFLQKILNDVERQILPVDVKLNTIVVVDGSTDGTIEMLENDYPACRIIKGNGDWWWTRCMNEGFKEAIALGSDAVLILNDDNEILPDYLSILYKDYRTLKEGSILTSASLSIIPYELINFAGTKSLSKWNLKAIPYLRGMVQKPKKFEGVHPTQTMCGRGTLIPVSVFSRIGLFDPKLVQYGSDDEYAIRANRAGIPVLISWNTRIYNHMMMTSEGSPHRHDSFSKYLRSFTNPYSINSLSKTVYYYKKHGIRFLLPFYIVYFVLGSLKSYLFNYR
jgi:GT2 family glycosyltransferase